MTKLREDSSLIWLGKDEIARKVVVKFFHDDDSHFLRDSAKILARVNHKNIVSIYAVDGIEHPETKEYTECIIMHYVEGNTLMDTLEHRISEDKAYNLGNQLINAIEAIHKSGLVHGDLHDENILVSKEEILKVIDMYPRGSFTKISERNRNSRIQSDLISLTRVLIEIIRSSEINIQTSQFSKLLKVNKNLSIPYIRDIFIKKPKCSVKSCDKDALVEVFLYDKYSHNGDEYLQTDFTCPYLCGEHQIENERTFLGEKKPRIYSKYKYTNRRQAQGYSKYKYIGDVSIFSCALDKR